MHSQHYRGAARRRRSHARIGLAALGPGIAASAGYSTIAAAKQDKGYGADTISTRADRVSGGDVLVKITYKHDNRNHPLQITLNGVDVSGAFRPGDDPNSLVGLVTGLAI